MTRSRSMPILQDVLTIVVTFNGADTVARLVDSCVDPSGRLVSPILVIDNDSSDHTVEVLEGIAVDGIEFMWLARNIGVAAAYNRGLEQALSRGAGWMLMLDQDSICGPAMLKRLRATARRLEREDCRIGAVCPLVSSFEHPDCIHLPYRWGRRGLETVAYISNDQDQLIKIDSCLTSGTLYNVHALEDIGGFREDYFIDFVDHECHLRLRKKGWGIWWDVVPRLYHRLGRIQRDTDQGLWIEHEPVRYYYMARNMLDGHYRFGGMVPTIHFLRELLRHMVRIFRYGKSPYRSSYFIMKGIGHAICGRFGPIDR